MDRMIRGWSGLVLIAAIAAAVPFLLSKVVRTGVPAKLAGLQIVRLYEGKEALAIVSKMHRESVTTENNTIGVYVGPEGSATLYLTIYPAAGDAQLSEQRMGQRIAEGDSGFTNFQRMMVNGKQVSVCVGLGQVHCFFSHGSRLYWLASDFGVARDVLKDLMAQSVR
jgi:hypothetical protein